MSTSWFDAASVGICIHHAWNASVTAAVAVRLFNEMPVWLGRLVLPFISLTVILILKLTSGRCLKVRSVRSQFLEEL